MVKVILFDMDGLLIDSERGMWLVNERRSIKELGYLFNEDFIRTCMGSGVEEYKRKVHDYFGKDFPVDKYYDMLLEYNDIMIKNNEIKLMRGCKELLNFLKENHIVMRVATSTPLDIAIPMLQRLEIFDYFEEIVSGQDVPRGKPYPDVYLKALGDYSKEDALIFEDGHNGAMAGFAAGIPVVLVPDVAYIAEEDRTKAFAVIEHLDDAIALIKKTNKL